MRLITHIDNVTSETLTPPYYRARLIVEEIYVDEQHPYDPEQPQANNRQIHVGESELADLGSINDSLICLGCIPIQADEESPV